MIRFELPFNLPSLNQLLRARSRGFHGRAKGVRKARSDLAWAVIVALAGQRPREPLKRVRIRIERHAARMLDPLDNLPGSFKPLMDVLQPCSRQHPAGIGVILDDSPACVIVTEVVQVRLGTGEAPKTVIIIEEA